MSQRTERVDELLRQEIGRALEREVADPRIGFATVTGVETSPDLSHAWVSISLIGSAAERKEAVRALRGAMPFIQRSLGPRLRLRRMPKLELRVDDSVERGTRVLRLLDQLEAGRMPEDVPAVGESLPTPVRRLPHDGDAAEGRPEKAGEGRRLRRGARPGRGDR
jgi:ribosome-binding factor A